MNTARTLLRGIAALVVLTHRGLRALPTPEKWDLGGTDAHAASPTSAAPTTTVEA